MIYPKGHYWVAFVLVITILGFLQSYFLKINDVPLAFHVHAFTATIWTALVMTQSWTIHNRKNALHKQMGQVSLVLFPFLIVGFVMIINVSAQRFIAAENPYSEAMTPHFGMSMVIAIVTYLTLFYMALKHRRTIHLHAGFLLATPLILFESPFSRLMLRYFDWMVFTTSEGPQFILDAIVISMLGSALFGLVIYFRNREKGSPFLIAAIFLVFSSVAMGIGGKLELWRDVFAMYAAVPEMYTIVVGFLLGAVVTWRGWIAGSSR